MRKNRILIALLVVAAIGMALLWRGKKEPQTTQVFDSPPGLQIEADQLSGLNIKVPGGEKNSYWLLNFAKFTDLGEAGALDSISGEYIQESKPIYRLTADSGSIHWQSQQMTLYGPRVAAMDQTKEISAAEMLWEPKTGQISAKRQVFVRVNDLIVRTEELTADLELDRFVLKGSTTATSEEE
ncbi:MAG: LPS export ABC transporter periplasmic protein LptC [Firmicutes bacterium]|nr:LPS export ABC transporter periplasmic protein LptC [Bacillota bacterium]